MIKVFISQPMSGRKEKEILAEREAIKTLFTAWSDDKEICFLESFIKGAENVDPLFCLGCAITDLSKADVVVFAPNWESARGCLVEQYCCKKYNKQIVYIDVEDLRG